jgi:uncharacterized membrane protein YphA (DoxX/SURF4 family)
LISPLVNKFSERADRCRQSGRPETASTLKFVYANQGVGRFTKLGIPFPHFTATFIGGLEIVGGLLLLAGLATRLIAIPFVAEMLVAILWEPRPCLYRQHCLRRDSGLYYTRSDPNMRKY